MAGLLEGKLAQEHLDKETYVIGAGTTGLTVASMLNALGFQTTILEAGNKAFHARTASVNNTGIFHSLLFSSDAKTMQHQFNAALAFAQLTPDWTIHRDHINFILPHFDHTGMANSAITGRNGEEFKEEWKLSWAMECLTSLYSRALANGTSEYFGKPEDLFREMTSDDMIDILGIRYDTWLGEGSNFHSAHRVNMPVANVGKFATHFQRLAQKLTDSENADIFTGRKVLSIKQEEGEFIIKTEDGGEFHAHNVINTAYTNGPFIEVEKLDGEKLEVKPTIIKFKTFVVIQKPEEMEGLDFAGVIAARTYAPYILDVGPNLLAINSTEYNISEFKFPEDGGIAAYEIWLTETREKLMADETYIQRTLDQAAEFYGIPWLKDSKGASLRMAAQPYPDHGKNPDLILAAKRDAEIHETLDNENGSSYKRVLGAKLTSIPLAAMETVLENLQPLIDQGQLQQKEVDKLLRVDENGVPWVSEELRAAMMVNEREPVATVLSVRESSEIPSGYDSVRTA